MDKALKILIVDDSEDDALLLEQHLKRMGKDPETRCVDNLPGLRAALDSGEWDAILCDVAMPELDALGALAELKSTGKDIPFIAVSGVVPEEQLVDLMKSGVHDIIVKDRLSRLDAVIEREINEAASRRERQQAEERLRTSEELSRLAFETAPHGMALVSMEGQWLQVNKALCDLVGYSREELLNLDFQTITHPDDLVANLKSTDRILSGELQTYQTEKRYIRKDGSPVWVMQSNALVRDGDGNPRYFISQSVDLSALKNAEVEQARLEDQLRHAQKMESIGTLSGGIAHEFNNLLLPIWGLIELSLEELDGAAPSVTQNLKAALDNVVRAEELVNKILTFSRIDRCELVRASVSNAIDDAVTLLRATIPATIQISKNLDNIGLAYIDRTQISQIVMNLGINAMHAIGPEVGRINFNLEAEITDERRMTISGPLPPGTYAKLSVKDSGCGMDGETMNRIFEPFFTTKEVGQGTGMGLAFVHGVVTAHGGLIDVTSQPGHGTTFDVYLPLLHVLSSDNGKAASARSAGSSE